MLLRVCVCIVFLADRGGGAEWQMGKAAVKPQAELLEAESRLFTHKAHVFRSQLKA